MKHTVIGVNILRHLASNGKRIFTLQEARDIAQHLNINMRYIAEAMHYLLKAGWITHLKRGLYAFSAESGFCTPPHEFEIAMALCSPCSVSHWTAMHYHHLTQQTPNIVFAITPSTIPRSANTQMYHFTKVKKEWYFGIEKRWMDQMPFYITDPERTLLDGLMQPKYCGDFQEVLHAFKMHRNELNTQRIVEYALQLDQATIKRTGWLLEYLHIEEPLFDKLLHVPLKGYRKLDPTGPAKGPYNKKWMIQENLGM